jgi:4-amino-4-deoxy-L-arabinose transferase-like glycosyltransferase
LPHLFDGRPELQKPPLYYWLVASFTRALGGRVEAWTVRLPSALAALACVMGLYVLGLRSGRPIAGLVASAVLATAMHFTWLARTGRIDMPLTLTVSVAVWGLTRPLAGRRSPWSLLLGYLALAAGILLKGPVGAVLPVAVAVLFSLLYCRRNSVWSLPRLLGPWWGLPLVALLTLPWFLWANAQTDGEWFRVFFQHHNLERFLGSSPVLKAHPWWLYFPQFAGDFLPWTPLLLTALWYFWRRGWWRADAAACLGLTWLLAVLAVLSCSAFKRADYLLPAYPGAALFLGCVAERWLSQAPRPVSWTASFGAVVLLCVVAWGLQIDWNLTRAEGDRDYRPFAEEVRRLAPPPQPIFFFRTETHALAFHVGRPLELSVEWEQLDAWIALPRTVYIVMPARCLDECPARFQNGRLEEVARFANVAGPRSDQPLLLLRTRPVTESADARATPIASDCQRADQCRPAGP